MIISQEINLMKMKKYFKDDLGNYSITRLGFFIILILIVCLSICSLFITVDIYLISLLIGFDLSLVGVKNWKDIIQKIK